MPSLVITVGPPDPWVSHPWIQPTKTHSEVGECMDAEPRDKEDQLYQVILHKGLAHLWILVSVGGPAYSGTTAVLAALLEAGMVIAPFCERHGLPWQLSW